VIKISKLLLKILTIGTAHAITLYPFIILKNNNLKTNSTLINHEKIHLKQQIELLIIPFYILYLFEYIIRRFQYSTHHEAYCNISFEREAYKNQTNLDYLYHRKFWSFRSYFIEK